MPIGLVIGLNYGLSQHVLPGLSADYLAQPAWGATSLDKVVGKWAIILSLLAAIVVLVATLFRHLDAPVRTLGAGAEASLLPIFNTASLVGFGAVIAALPIFAEVTRLLDGAPGGPLVSLALSTSLLAGITGSASGGMSIALGALGAEYAAAAAQAGIDPGLLHRGTALATGGLDALPHNGAVVTLLGICGLSHRQAYGDIFVVAVAIPVVALVVVIALGLGLGTL
jgi:H+/gluconate symporter-like permease